MAAVVRTEAGKAAPLPGRPTGAASAALILEQWWPALPLLAVIGTLLLAPALLLVWQSVVTTEGVGLGNWIRVFGDGQNRGAVVTTLELAVASATVSTIVGAPVAWVVRRMLPVPRSMWLALLNVAGNFGGIGLAFAFFATLGTQGMVTLALQGLGTGFEPPRSSSFTGLLLAYLYTNVPLFILLTIPAMGSLRDDWFEAAEVASATRWQFWRRVGIPVLAPFLLGGWLLIFTWSIGIYSIAFGLAGNVGASPISLITLQIGEILQSDVFGRGRAAVLAVVLMAFATIALLAYRAILRRALRWF